jgi:aryl-alcohol dehydrogenase-like predicted oxidoreductase
MRGVAQAHGVSVARVALAWVLAKPFVTTVIIGARNTDQVEDNIAASGLRLTAEDIARLDAVSALSPEYPGWMLDRQGGNRAPREFVKA